MIISDVPVLLRKMIWNELSVSVDVYDNLGNLISSADDVHDTVSDENVHAYGINALKAAGNDVIPVYEGTNIKYYLDCGTETNSESRAKIGLIANVVLRMEKKEKKHIVPESVFWEETDLVGRMLSKDASIYHNDIVALGSSMGYKLEHPMIMIVTMLETNYNYCLNMNLGYESASRDAKYSILKRLKEHQYMNKQDIVVFVENNRLVLLKAVEELNDTRKMYMIIKKLQEMISDVLKSYRIFRYYIAPGEIIENFDVAHQRYEGVLEYISFAQKMNMDHPIITRDDIFYYAIISRLPHEYRIDVIEPKVQALLELNTEIVESIIQCFEVYTDNGFNINTTADIVYLHRNTIRKRFEKLYQITGYDPAGDFKSILMNKFILQQYLITSRGQQK